MSFVHIPQSSQFPLADSAGASASVDSLLDEHAGNITSAMLVSKKTARNLLHNLNTSLIFIFPF
jgi:hypothetical protein